MQPSNSIAFKEWAVICAALAEGRQAMILRKGGIHEGRGGFRVEHREFWLFPTYLHQQADSLVEDAGALLARVEGERPADGAVRIGCYGVVEDVIELGDAAALTALTGLHLWSHRTVDMRFHYKRPGLFVLPVRVYRLPRPFELPDTPFFAGCRTWVELPRGQPTAGAEPVLGDQEFARRLDAIRRAAATARLA